MRHGFFKLFYFLGLFTCSLGYSIEYIDEGVGVSSNPSPSDHIGTGYLGEKLFKKWHEKNTGLSLEGLWIFDANALL